MLSLRCDVCSLDLAASLHRANSPEAAIAKAEGALRESEHKLSKANDKLVKLDAQIKAIESEWESSLAESLKKCTFKVKGRDIKDIEGSMQKSAQQGNATALLTKLMKMEGHGAQLAYVFRIEPCLLTSSCIHPQRSA